MTSKPIESYQFDSLGDREKELQRLISQATIGEEIEISTLKKLGLEDGMKLLDLGSGPGVTSILIAKRFPLLSTIGIEPEQKLRAEAEMLAASKGLSERCRFIEGVGDNIPLEDKVIDFCYARLLFQHLPNPLEVLEEMQRVTKKGGKVVIVDVDDSSNILHPSPEGMSDLENHIGRVQAAAGGDRHIGRKLQGLLHQRGFVEVSVHPVPITADNLGRETFFNIVYSFKRQLLERSGEYNDQSRATFAQLEKLISLPSTFAMTTVFAAHGVVN